MKKIIYLVPFLMFFSSCYKEDIKPQQPIDPQPIITDTTFVDTTLSLKGQKWVIYKVLNTDFVSENREDTLEFIDYENYTYNGFSSKYSFNVVPNTYKLTLYDTPWGNLCGDVFNYNILSGMIDGLDFFDIFNNNRKIKIWIKRI